MQVTTKQRVGINPVTPLPFLSCCSSTWLSLLAPFSGKPLSGLLWRSRFLCIWQCQGLLGSGMSSVIRLAMI